MGGGGEAFFGTCVGCERDGGVGALMERAGKDERRGEDIDLNHVRFDAFEVWDCLGAGNLAGEQGCVIGARSWRPSRIWLGCLG